MAKSSLIGRIAFDLVANTGKLIAPMKQADSVITKFTSKFSKFAGIGAGIGGAIAGFASVHKAVTGVTTAFSELGALSDESKRIGVAAEDLSALQYAAQQSGVDIDSLSKSLQYMMKKGMNVGQLGRIADELRGIEDPVLRMQKALAYFGKGGAPMINMLAGGSIELKRMTDEAAKLGIVVSQRQADLAEEAGDAWERFGLATKGFARQVAVELAPAVSMISDQLTSWTVSISSAAKELSLFQKATMEVAYSTWLAKMGLEMTGIFAKGYGAMAGGFKPVDIKNFWAEGDRWFQKFIGRSPDEELKRKYQDALGWRPPASGTAGKGGSLSPITSAASAANDMAPLLRGSQAALSYILGTGKQDYEKASYEKLKELTDFLKKKSASGGLFGPALLSNGG